MTKRTTKDDDASELVKKSKIDVISTTALTDINHDCLYAIFRWLNFHDLMALAETNGHFVEPINMILRKINKQKTFTSVTAYHNWRLPPPGYFTNFIVVPSHLFQYVGQSILKLFIDFTYVSEKWSFVLENHIMEQCIELKELKFLNFRNGAFETIKKPFDKLEVLTLSNGILGQRFSRFQQWFPQLRSLTVDCNVHDKSYIPNNMAKMIPSLEFLSLTLSEVIPENCSWPKKSFRCKIDDVIKTNRQLKHIRLDFGCENRDLRVVNKELKQLETVELRIKIQNFRRSSKRPIEFGSVKKLILEIDCQTYLHADNIKCAMVFDNLEELEISSSFFFKKWFFITSSINLKKLKFTCQTDFLKFEQLLQISSTWPNLTDVTMHLRKLSLFEMFSFIRSLHNLERFNVLKHSFSPQRLLEIEEMKAYISNEYEMLPGTKECHYSIIRQT